MDKRILRTSLASVSLLFLATCSTLFPGGRQNSIIETNKEVHRRMILEVMGDGNFDVVPELFHADWIGYSNGHEYARGRYQLILFWSMYHEAFPEMVFEIEEQVAQDNRVATRWVCTGRQQGEFLGKAPTGREVKQVGITISRFQDGKSIECHTVVLGYRY